MPDMLSKLDLAFNPFEPAASGPPVGIAISPPDPLAERLRNFVNTGHHAPGPKVFVILGDYGTGKTCLLRWLHDRLASRSADQAILLRQPRRALLRSRQHAAENHRPQGLRQVHLGIRRPAPVKAVPAEPLSARLRGILDGPRVCHDVEAVRISWSHSRRPSCPRTSRRTRKSPHCLARIVTDAVRKPYFEYRDFLPSKTESLVAEAAEAPYFGAILTTLVRGSGADAIAFLIDEFEEIGLQKRLTRRAAHDYLSTLKALDSAVSELELSAGRARGKAIRYQRFPFPSRGAAGAASRRRVRGAGTTRTKHRPLEGRAHTTHVARLFSRHVSVSTGNRPCMPPKREGRARARKRPVRRQGDPR